MKKLYKVEKYSSKEKWLNARGIGGSSASAIENANPYMSKLELYRVIKSNKKKKLDTTNTSMKYGINLEPLIRDIYRYDTESKYQVIDPKPFEMFRRIDKPFMTATIDGQLVEKSTKRKGILEIKTHDIRNRIDYQNWNGRIPDNYFIQVIHYLAVLNDFEFAVLCAKLRYFKYDLNDKSAELEKSEIRYYYIERSEVIKEIEKLEKDETDFWENNILKGQMPSVKIMFNN